MLVLHYTGMTSGRAALERLCDASAKVSAHYVVEENGEIFALVDEQNRAWHAGVSAWRGHANVNARSIGVEIVNPGHEYGYRPFPDAQVQAVITLCQAILSRHSIPARNVVGHSDIAPTRKKDPGELFPWDRLAREGIGLSGFRSQDSGVSKCEEANPADRKIREDSISPDPESRMLNTQQALVCYGYAIEITGIMDDQTRAVITAFQRHFRPTLINGEWDAECTARLDGLLAFCGEGS